MPDQSPICLTKIIATLGPAACEVGAITRLIEEGARVFRINFSHGDFEHFDVYLRHVQQASQQTDTPVPVLGDLPGPKVRLGRVAGDGITVEPGSEVALQTEPVEATAVKPGEITVLSTNTPQVLGDIAVGQRVLIDDGAVRMLAVDRQNDGRNVRVICLVTVGGIVSTAKGVNLPDTELSLPSLTKRDHQCVDWAIEHELDFLALSFARSAADIRALKDLLADRAGQRATPLPVIAKIEKPQALTDLPAIIDTADGVMVARGDLGVEMDLAEVPIIQKRIITMAHEKGKAVIVATQMLQSMIDRPSPTRAEVSDVANAIFDGADAVMLSGETAVGKYPVQAVTMMARVALSTQSHESPDTLFTLRTLPPRSGQDRYRTAALARGVATIVNDLAARLVVTWSQSGGGARYLSNNRLNVPILAASDNAAALRRMALLYGVVPVPMQAVHSRQTFAALMDKVILQSQLAEQGDPIVMVAGEPLTTAGVTNTIWVRYVGDDIEPKPAAQR